MDSNSRNPEVGVIMNARHAKIIRRLELNIPEQKQSKLVTWFYAFALWWGRLRGITLVCPQRSNPRKNIIRKIKRKQFIVRKVE